MGSWGLSGAIRTVALSVLLIFLAASGADQGALGNGLAVESLRVSVFIIGNATADATGLFFEPNEFNFSPPPILVNVTFTNGDVVPGSDQPHNFTIRVNNTFFQTPLLNPTETGSVEFWLNETGRFEFECAVPGHASLGMVGAFVVGAQVGEGPVETQGLVEIRAYWIGLIGLFSMVAIVIVSYFIIKYESRHHTDHREHRRRRLP